MLDSARQTVLEYAKRSYEEKLFQGTSGNLSIYDRESGCMAITPSGIDYTIMQLDDVVVMKLDGTVLEGSKKPSSEWRMHAAIYKGREDVTAVVHTHSPCATAFSVVGKDIPVILIEMVPFLGGNVRVADFVMPGTEELGDEAVKAMHNRTCCILENHGVVAVGKTMERAHIVAVYVEDAANIYSRANAIGEPRVIPDDILRKMRAKYNLPED